MVWFADEDFVGVVDDLSEFDIFCFELSDDKVLLIKFIAQILTSLHNCFSLRASHHCFTVGIEFAFQFGYPLLIGGCFIH